MTTVIAGLFLIKPSVLPESMYHVLLVTSQATNQRGKGYSLGYDFYVKVDRVVCWDLGLPREFLPTLEGNLCSEHCAIAKHNGNLEGHQWGKQGICSFLLRLLQLINGALRMKRGVSYGIINIHSSSLILLRIF